MDPILFAVIHEGLGEKTEALAELEKAYNLGSEEVLNLAIQPLHDSLRGDPRYEDLVRRMGLTP